MRFNKDDRFNYRHGITVAFDYVGDDPVMVIMRKKRNAKIGLSVLWRYAMDEYMIASCTEIAKRLGLGTQINTVAYLCSVVENHFDDLADMEPLRINPMQTQNDLDKAVEQYGLKINLDGENLLH